MSEIDPNIPLAVRPGVQPMLPIDQVHLAAQRANLASIGQEQQLRAQHMQINDQSLAANALKAQEQADALRRAAQVRDVLMRDGLTDESLKKILPIDPAAHDMLFKHLDERRKADAADAAAKDARVAKFRTSAASYAQSLLDEPDLAKREAQHKVIRDRLHTDYPDLVNKDNYPEGLPPEEQLRAYAAYGRTPDAQQTTARANQTADDAHLSSLATISGKRVDPETGLNPAQTATNTETERQRTETERHNRAMENIQRDRVDDGLTPAQRAVQQRAQAKSEKDARMVYQREIESGQRDITALQAKRVQAESDIAKYQEQLAARPEGMLGGSSTKRKEALANLAKAREEQQSIIRQQQEHKTRMDSAQRAKDALPGGKNTGAEAAVDATPEDQDAAAQYLLKRRK